MRRGEFHDEFCRDALSIVKASVRGRLDTSGRYPVLTVPEPDILAIGTADVAKDLDLQERHAACIEGADILDEDGDAPFLPRVGTRSASSALDHGPSAAGGRHDAWGWVAGELITLDDAFARLPTLDRLEGFRPAGKSLYRRVLLPVRVQEMVGVAPAWTYVTC